VTGAVRYEVRGPAAWLTIDREDRRNALSDEVVTGLAEGLDRAAADPGVRAVVLTGSGELAFCGAAMSAEPSRPTRDGFSPTNAGGGSRSCCDRWPSTPGLSWPG
jgi:enoyl-CoA hydratase/carnithine racemase